MLIWSRRGQLWKWFRRGLGVPRKIWPLEQPGPETVAYGLLRGSHDNPGPVDVGADGWIERKDAWWYTVREDSVVVGDGEVLTLLWWLDEAQLDASMALAGTWLPWKPSRNARSRLIKALEEWGYRRLPNPGGPTLLKTGRAPRWRLSIPSHEKLDEATLRGLVAEAAAQLGVTRDQILESMLVEPKWVAKRRS